MAKKHKSKQQQYLTPFWTKNEQKIHHFDLVFWANSFTDFFFKIHISNSSEFEIYVSILELKKTIFFLAYFWFKMAHIAQTIMQESSQRDISFFLYLIKSFHIKCGTISNYMRASTSFLKSVHTWKKYKTRQLKYF